MNLKIRNYQLLGMLLVCLAGCDGESVLRLEGDQMTVPVPAGIRQIAALRNLPIEFKITVNGELKREVPYTGEAEVITRIVNVPVDQNNEVSVAWYATQAGNELLLADFSDMVPVGDTVLNVTNYISEGGRFDADNDGRSNLTEARDNRNLLSAIDLAVPLQSGFGGVFANITTGGVDNDSSGEVVEQDDITTFSLRHDGSDLVVYVCGQDKTLRADSIATNGQYWHDDTVFIYLDGADSDSDNSYDNIDDFQLAFVRGTGEMRVSKGGGNQFCPGAACVSHSFFNNSTSCQYELTVNLPINELNMSIGSPIGFDIEITDDDNGGLREGAASWIGLSDQSNLDPSTFGTIQLN